MVAKNHMATCRSALVRKEGALSEKPTKLNFDQTMRRLEMIDHTYVK